MPTNLKLEDDLEKSKNKLHEVCNDFLQGKIKGSIARSNVLKIKKEIENRLNYYSEDEQIELKELLKKELEFIYDILNSRSVAEVITQEKVESIFNRKVKKDDIEKETKIKDETTINVSKYEDRDVVRENIGKITDLERKVWGSVAFDSIKEIDIENIDIENKSYLEESIKYFKDIEKEANTLAGYFRSGEGHFDKKKGKTFEDEWHFEQFKRRKHKVLECLYTNNYKMKYLELLLAKNNIDEQKKIDIKVEIDKCQNYFNQRIEFLNKELETEREKQNPDETLISSLKLKISMFEEKIKNCDFVLEENNRFYKETKDIKEKNNVVTNLDYFNSLEEMWNKKLENMLEKEAIDFETTNVVEGKDEELSKYNEIIESALDELVPELKDNVKVENENIEVKPVVKRIDEMVKQKDISSKESLQKEIDDICKEMLDTNTGYIDEKLFLEIDSVLEKVNSKTKSFDKEVVKKFSREFFRDGNPKYLYGEMDENEIEKFYTLLLGYERNCENDIFTESEKENFEKFIMLPYKLRYMQEDIEHINKKDLENENAVAVVDNNKSQEQENIYVDIDEHGHHSLYEDEYFEYLLKNHEGQNLEKTEYYMNYENDNKAKQYEEETIHETITEPIEEETIFEENNEPENVNPEEAFEPKNVNTEENTVAKRINEMVKQKDISSKKSIQKEIDGIYNEMLAPKKKKGFLKKEKKNVYGNIKEELFMDVRSVFARINMESQFLDEKYADNFARLIFKNGIPQYMFGNMDEKVEREFLVGIKKYLEMAESGKFSKEEKDIFEKFVLQPYMLKSMESKEKDFNEELKNETLSQEEIVKTKAQINEKEKEERNVNKEI